MDNRERFDAFRGQMIEENEQHYAAEIRSRYEDEVIDAANAKLADTSEAGVPGSGSAEGRLHPRRSRRCVGRESLRSPPQMAFRLLSSPYAMNASQPR